MNSRTKAPLSMLIKEIEIDGRLCDAPHRLPREGEVRAPTSQMEAAGIEPAYHSDRSMTLDVRCVS
jgi:hypothetical protein